MDNKPGILSKPASLAGLVQYQDDSVVSREVIRKPSGTVTVFAFDKGQGLSEHTAPFDAMVHILDGEAEIIVSGVKFNVKSGEALIMPAGEPHSLSAVERFKMTLIMAKS